MPGYYCNCGNFDWVAYRRDEKAIRAQMIAKGFDPTANKFEPCLRAKLRKLHGSPYCS